MNVIIKKVALAAAISCTLSSAAFAGASANIGVMSDYVWRGDSQNNNNASLMGGLDYEADNGLYVGTWAANVANKGDDLEVDIYAGFAKELANGFGYDIGAISYIYPGVPGTGVDFTEIYANGSYKFIELGVASTVNADDATTEGDLYTHLTLSKDIGPFGASATVGRTDPDAAGKDGQSHYQLAASYEIPENFGELTGAIDKVDKTNGAANDSVVSLTWSKSFDF